MTPPDSVQHNVYSALPGAMRPRSLVRAELTNWAAPGPRISALPRWLTSNRPTALRVALCSLTVPAYDTGISQPLNSAKLAPNSRWRSSSGPCSNSGASPTTPHPNRLFTWQTWVGVRFLGLRCARGRRGGDGARRSRPHQILGRPWLHGRRDGRSRTPRPAVRLGRRCAGVVGAPDLHPAD